MHIDDTDRRIVRHMLADPMIGMAELAAATGLSTATCWRRVERLREARILRTIHAVIDWRALGWAVEVSLRFTLDKTHPRAFDEFIAAARTVPEVLEIQTFLGQTDVRLNAIARDMAHWQDIYRARILTLPHIQDTEALMLISSIKNTGELPL